MTSADRNDLVPAQEKLEWVTPKISLMGAGDTEGSGKPFPIFPCEARSCVTGPATQGVS
jgi:hypothetical protein